MNSERLIVLADHLESLPQEAREHFDLEAWAGTVDEDGRVEAGFGPFDLERFVTVDDDGFVTGYIYGSCDTRACAIGHAGSIPEFQAAGFKLFADSRFDGDWHNVYPVLVDEDGDERVTGWTAVALFFDIDDDVAEHLFMASSYGDDDDASPAGVAARIREVVEYGGVPTQFAEV